eukprot:7637716-Alexandrium_andersonii.AAC.1
MCLLHVREGLPPPGRWGGLAGQVAVSFGLVCPRLDMRAARIRNAPLACCSYPHIGVSLPSAQCARLLCQQFVCQHSASCSHPEFSVANKRVATKGWRPFLQFPALSRGLPPPGPLAAPRGGPRPPGPPRKARPGGAVAPPGETGAGRARQRRGEPGQAQPVSNGMGRATRRGAAFHAAAPAQGRGCRSSRS